MVHNIVLSKAVSLETRRAQNLSPSLKAALLKLCEGNSSILNCFVLDARRPGSEEIGLIMAVTLKSGQAEMDSIATQFEAMLREFPERAKNAFLMSSDTICDRRDAGSEFYVRRTGEAAVTKTSVLKAFFSVLARFFSMVGAGAQSSGTPAPAPAMRDAMSFVLEHGYDGLAINPAGLPLRLELPSIRTLIGNMGP